MADTVLLNPDGSFVVDEADPEMLFTRPNNKITWQSHKPSTEKYGGPPGMFGFLGSYGMNNFPVSNQGTAGSKVPVIPGGYIQYVTEKPYLTTPRSTASTEMRKTTKIDYHTQKYPATASPDSSDGNLILINTMSNSNKTVKPTPSTSKASTKNSYTTGKLPRPTPPTVEIEDHYPGFHYESYTGISKPPIIITSPVGFDGSGQAISHIIGILNNTNRKPEPQPVTTSGENDAGLSTWVTISGDNNNNIIPVKNKYPTGATALPGTTTNYVHGPGFTVQGSESKPAPTVIVISPPSTDASPGSYHQKPTKITPSEQYITKKPVRVTNKPSPTTPKYPESAQVLPSGEESLVNFPPVRNPDLNVSSLNQVEKPTIVHSGGYPLPEGVINDIHIISDDVDLNSIDPDEDYSDFTTPAMEDEKVNVKIHNFVEKIVNSLAGNFQDLEGVLFKNENKTKLPNQNGIELSNVQLGLVDSRPPTTKKPVRRPIVTTEEYDEVTETATKFPTKRPRPTTRPPATSFTTIPSIITSKKPLIQIATTKLTTTVKPVKRPTTPTVTTRKPPTVIFSTKRPTPVTVTGGSVTTRRPTTKRPRPSTTINTTTKRTTRPTVAESSTEEIEFPTTEPVDAAEHSTIDFRNRKY